MSTLQILVDRLYSTKSCSDKSTIFQLKQLAHRSSFGKQPKNNMKATEDFLEVVVFAHITAATKNLKTTLTAPLTCTDLAKKLVGKFISIPVPTFDADGNLIDDNSDFSNTDDSVFLYAVDVLSMGLFWYGFRDAVREGDGDRIVLYWKFLLVIFRQEKHYNYSKEGFLFIAQTLLLSPRQLCDIKWNRTVNTTGRIGKNIPVDLHMEHLNKRLKIMIRNLGSNVSPTTVRCASKALAIVDVVRLQFLKDDNERGQNKDHHTQPSFVKDFTMIEQQLITDKVFSQLTNRQHITFPQHKPLFQTIKWKNICTWLKDKIINYNT